MKRVLNGRTLTQLDRLQRMRKGQALEGEAMEQTAAPRVAEAGVSSLGQSTPARVVGAAGPAESELRGLDERSARTRAFTTPAHEATKVISQNEPNEYGERALHFTAGVGCGADRIPRHFARGGRG